MLILSLLALSHVCFAQAPLRIMPLGDSITRGKDDQGYRTALAGMLDAKKIAFHFVGDQEHGPSGLRERAHEGHNGATINHLIPHVTEWVTTFKPDVVLLMIGANDVEGRRELEDMPARYQKLLDLIIAARPTTRILVSEISLIRPTEYNDLAKDFNVKLRRLVEVARIKDAPVTFVPMHDVLSLRDLDSVDHPDARGNRKMAERWMQYLVPNGTGAT